MRLCRTGCSPRRVLAVIDLKVLRENPDVVRASLEDPLIPAKVEDLAREDRGLVWVYMGDPGDILPARRGFRRSLPKRCRTTCSSGVSTCTRR